MQPITDPTSLHPGATVYHSAFGFASVREIGPDAVSLAWEREGTHLPTHVRFDALKRVYSACAPDGFFHKALHDAAGLSEVLHHRPADAILWLLHDLGGPQRLRDLMDWLVGRGLFTPKTFVRWWGTAEALLKADPRLSWEGEWVQRRPQTGDEPAETRLTQLEPGLVDVELGDELDRPDPTLPPEDDRGDDPLVASDGVYTPTQPVPLAEATLPASAFLTVARELARSLARAHAEGRPVTPRLDGCVLLPDGQVLLEQGEPAAEPGRAQVPSREEDLRLAATALLEAFLGRHVPPGQSGAALLPFLRHRLPELAPSALAPLYGALHDDPHRRPTAASWVEHWERLHRIEAERLDAWDRALLPVVGYDSHVGRVKLLQTQVNQDAVWVGLQGERGLFVLCDGISVADAGRGDIASKLGTQAIARLWQLVSDEDVPPRRLLDRALHLANRAICERALRAANGDLTHRMPMGTTVTVAVTHGSRVHLAWLGDSRAFLVGDFGISQLTADDNVSGERFLAWCDRRARAWDPNGHALVRYLGHFDEAWSPAPFPAHHVELNLRPGERLVITSDGITDYVAHHEPEVALELLRCVRDRPPYEAAQRLVTLANQRGGGDNASVIVVHAPEPTDYDAEVTDW